MRCFTRSRAIEKSRNNDVTSAMLRWYVSKHLGKLVRKRNSDTLAVFVYFIYKSN